MASYADMDDDVDDDMDGNSNGGRGSSYPASPHSSRVVDRAGLLGDGYHRAYDDIDDDNDNDDDDDDIINDGDGGDDVVGWKVRVASHCGRNLVCHCSWLLLLLVVAAAVALATWPLPRTIEGVEPGDVPVPSDTLEHTVWFLQVSDTHISDFVPERQQQFEQFCGEVVPAVRPSLVIHTGDITDGYEKDARSQYVRMSKQSPSEWGDYRDTLAKYGYNDSNFWLDVRGNHDAFAVDTYESSQNLYRTYGVRGSYPRQNAFLLNTTFGSTYGFVSADQTMSLGLKVPFQFWGIPVEIDALQSALEATNKVATQTILYGHHPRTVSSILFPWKSVTSSVSVYLCGHLHSPSMYHRMPGGYLELELIDMKSHKGYRVMAFDHELFSFADVTLGEWPVVLITNPKDARFFTKREPIGLIGKSTHIRCLVFGRPGSDSASLEVTVSIDGSQPQAMSRAVPGEPLFVFPWDASQYASGMHSITVRVVNATDSSQVSEVTQKFSLNGDAEPIALTPESFTQAIPTHAFLITAFVWSYFGLVLWCLVIPKIYYVCSRTKNDKGEWPQIDINRYFSLRDGPRSKISFSKVFWFSMRMELRRRSRLSWFPFTLLTLYALDILVGPLLAGPVVDFDHWGFIVMYGAMTEDMKTAAVESMIIALLTLWLLFWPCVNLLLAVTAVALARKREQLGKAKKKGRRCSSPWAWYIFWLTFLVVLVLLGLMAVLRFMSGYGVLLAPVVWWFPLAVVITSVVQLILQHRKVYQQDQFAL